MQIIQSNFGNKGNFEAVIQEGTHLTHYWRNNDDGVMPWYKTVDFGDSVDSTPALIQSNFGNIGNFEVIVKEGNKLRHYWRNNDDAALPWNKGDLFGDNVDSAPALIQSNFGNYGSFEAVVKEGDKLRHYWRDNDTAGFPWIKGDLFGDSVGSAPALIQSNFGNKGNFEVVVREGSKLRQYWRNNDDSALSWNKGGLFGDNVDSAPALIQSNFGNMGNFEVIVNEGNKLRHYWRNNDDPTYPWNKGVVFSDHITAPSALIQSAFGNQGNFEIIAKRGKCLVLFWRDNDVSLSWSEEIHTHAIVPMGMPPTVAQENIFLNWFKNLRNFQITAPAAGAYNCISWSVGVTTEWLWPGSTVADFDAFYASYGWTPAANGKREYQKRKVALWAQGSSCTHGSRETYDCEWHESKCGSAERIMHDKYQMQDGSYGKIIKYYEKYDPTANLDLS